MVFLCVVAVPSVFALRCSSNEGLCFSSPWKVPITQGQVKPIAYLSVLNVGLLLTFGIFFSFKEGSQPLQTAFGIHAKEEGNQST